MGSQTTGVQTRQDHCRACPFSGGGQTCHRSTVGGCTERLQKSTAYIRSLRACSSPPRSISSPVHNSIHVPSTGILQPPLIVFENLASAALFLIGWTTTPLIARSLIPTSRYLNPPNSQVPPLANRFRNQASTAQPLVGCTTAIFIFKQAPPAPHLPCLRHQSIPYNRFDVPFATVIGPLANAQSTSLAPQTRPTSAKQQIIMLLRPSTSGLAGKLQLVYPPQV